MFLETVILEDETGGDDHKRSPIRAKVPKRNLEGFTMQSLWNKCYCAKGSTSTRVPFAKDFPNNFKVVSQIWTRYLPNMVESHLFWGLMLERIFFSTHDQSGMSVDELKAELNSTKK